MERLTKFFLVLVGLCVASFSGLQAQFTVKRTAGNTGYLEYLPPDYYSNPSRKYPLMVFLHGKGERGSGSAADLEKVKKHGPPKEIVNGHNMCFEVDGVEECFIVIAPQLDGGKASWGIAFIDEVFEYVMNGPENYRFDPERIYLTGLSLGGNGVWKYAYSAQNGPNKLAAISPIAAWGKTSEGCVISERKIPVWAFHGDSDNTVGYQSGLNMFNAVKNCTTPAPTAELIFTTYEGVGHNSWGRAYTTDYTYHQPNLYEWLLSKKRNGGGTPVANAGPDRSITLPTNTLTLNGSANDPNGSIVSYAWTKISGGAANLSNQTTPNLTISNLQAGVYIFELTVTDNDGNTASDQAKVVVNGPANAAPVANAGPDITLTLPQNSRTINGSGSDTDGSIVSYSWSKLSGPAGITMNGSNQASLSVSALTEGIYIFELTVTDDDGASDTDQMQLTVNPEETNLAPTANAGPDITITLPVNSANITGQGIDTDGSITNYLWQLVSGPSSPNMTNTGNPTVTVGNLQAGVYTFSLTVTDNDGDTGTDEVRIIVQSANQPPSANAGPDQNITLPTSSINTAGSGSDADGSIQSYLWTQVSGPSAANILTPSSAITTINSLTEGTFTFRLTVTDDDGATDSDDMIINVAPEAANQAPSVNAGNDVSITLPVNSTTLTASASDPDGTIASYLWTKISGPSSFTIDDNTSSVINVSNLVAGTYVFRVRVTDNDGATAQDNVQVNVAPEVVNQAPVVSAGPDREITLPQSSLSITGSATDPDGTITGILWTQVSGPNTATLSGENTATLQASGLIEGEYTFRIKATDDQAATAEDVMAVRVNTANQPPVANAGADINIVLPQNSASITGIASDPEGEIASVAWTQVSGAAADYTVTGTQLSVTNLSEGSYSFEFTVTDAGGLTDSDVMIIEVTAANQLPIVSAGSDITLTLPVSATNINGTANDPDGTISSILWTQVSGNPAVIANANQLTATVSNLLEGEYMFRITATDNDGGSSSDEVIIRVNAEIINQPPVADAGPNMDLTLPVNSVNITGSGSDPDGVISSYLWEKSSGPSATMTGENQPTLQLSDLVAGTYRFKLTVTDDDGQSGSDEMVLNVNESIVNQLPTANAGADQTIQFPANTVTLFGQGSDPDGSITSFKWTQASGNPAVIGQPDNATTEISGLQPGNYVFNLEVTDNSGATDNDQVNVTVLEEAANQPPVADAGDDVTLSLPSNSIVLDGSGSDNDGSIVSYQWTKVSGPSSFTINDASLPQANVSGLSEGIYTLSLQVTDDDGAKDEDTMQIIVEAEDINTPPTALAGEDITIKLPVNKATLYGSGFDSDGTINSYLWSLVSGPSVPGLSSLNNSTLQMTDLTEGTYVMQLQVTDNDGAIDADKVNVIVLAADANEAPFVNAGNDQILYLPVNETTVNAEVFDPDGNISAIRWSKLNGPAAVIESPENETTRISGLVEGVYFFRITATDDDGAVSTDGLRITVQSEGVNQAPTVNAGPDLEIDLPENEVTVIASAADPDDNIVSITWDQTDGPSTAQIDNSTTLSPTFRSLQEGIYTFRLRATDAEGLMAGDRMRVTVNDPATTAPLVYAGEDIDIYTPQQEALLNAEISDDGYLDTLYWEQVSGKQGFISNPNNPKTLVQGLEEGTYIFRITVIDNDGLSGSDEVAVHVFAREEEAEYPMKVFTPNGDGANELWVLDPDVQRYEGCPVQIFNRQGQVVFETSSYMNSWDGTWNGQPVREGVYFFVLRCSAGPESLNGSITIVR